VTDPSHDVGEDAFHEIQLSGKQLVFLFMATTVVSVVIFLCGVLVGRGVRGEAVSASSVANASTPPAAASTAGVAVPDRTPPPVDPPAPAAEDPTKYSYHKRLESATPPVDALKPPPAESKRTSDAPKPTPTPAPVPAAATPAPAPAPVAAAATTVAAGTTTPSTSPTATRTGTWAVQVVALTDRAAATAVMQRLSSKGYPAFLVHPQPGAPVQHYKVQVGRYTDHGEADQVKARLKKEEQFEPFIVR
jgi:cell division septation protein DedD